MTKCKCKLSIIPLKLQLRLLITIITIYIDWCFYTIVWSNRTAIFLDEKTAENTNWKTFYSSL